VTPIAGGRNNGASAGNSDLRAAPEEMAEALGAGWLEL